MNRMNNQPEQPSGAALHLDKLMQQRQQMKVQAIQGRAGMAMAMLQNLIGVEEHTPKLPRARELINLAFNMTDCFNTLAVAPLQEDEKTIVKDG